MKIQRWILCIMLIFIVQVSYEAIPVLSEEDSGIQKAKAAADIKDIKNVIEAYYNSFAKKDLNSMVNQLSKDFSTKRGDQIVKYAEFKNRLKTEMDIFFTKHKDYSLISVNILNSDIALDKVVLEIEINYKAYNLSSLKYDIKKNKKTISLRKENNVWKIYKIISTIEK